MSDLPRTIAAVLVACVVASIGLPLLGIGSFSATDVLGGMPPWSEETPYDFRWDNGQVTDTVNGVLPARAVFRDRVWDGDLPLWDPLRGPGEPLAAVPNVGTFSPLMLPYVIAPLWLAPALTKLLEVAVATLGMYLLCRRWGLARASSLVGALAFVNSAFLVVWTNWPQAHVAALVPLLLWSVEHAVTARSVRQAWPVAVVSAVMWLEGFPSVTAYALLTAGAYAVVRVLVEHERLRHRLARLAALGGAVLLGFGLAAIQLLPFLAFLDDLELTRSRVAGIPLPWEQLATLAVPDALGSPVDGAYFGPTNYVEGQSWVGVVVLVLIAVLVAGGRRPAVPRGVVAFLGVAGGLGLLLVYVDSPLLDLFGRVPLLGSNNIGRLRAVLGVLAAAAAALGYEALVGADTEVDARRVRNALVAVGALVGGLAVVALWEASRADRLAVAVLQFPLPVLVAVLVAVVVLARAGGRGIGAGQVLWPVGSLAVVGGLVAVLALAVGLADGVLQGVSASAVLAVARSLAVPVLVAVLAVAAVATVAARDRRAGRGVRLTAAVAIPVLLAAEAVAFAHPWWARTPSDLVFPPTATHDFLAEHLDGERFAAADVTMYSSTNAVYGLRSLTSHSFMPPSYRELLRAVEPDAFDRSSTFPFLSAAESTARSPLLDRAGVRYWVLGPLDPLYGDRTAAVVGEQPLVLADADVVLAPISPGRLRGVTLQLLGTEGLAGRPALAVEVVDGGGKRVGGGATRLHRWVDPGPVPVAVPDVEVPPGSTLRVSLRGAAAGSVRLASDGRRPAFDRVAPTAGLQVVHTTGAVVYARERALPRVRWAGRSVRGTSPTDRLELLGGGLDDDVVVLGGTGPPDIRDATADLTVVEDAGDTVVVRVDATGDGHLVVADGIQSGWRAELDGRRVPVAPADHAFGAVAVPRGEHVVRLWYHPEGWTEGQRVSALALLLLVAWVALDRVTRGRAPSGRRGRRRWSA